MTKLGLLRAELRRDLWRALGLSCAVAVGVAAVAVVLFLKVSAERLLSSWAPATDRSLTVEPPRLALGSLGAKLDDTGLAALRALPGVQRAIPRMLLRVPALSTYRGNFFGQSLELTVEIAAEGVSEEAIEPEVFAGERFEWRPGEPLPACISEGLLSIYNSTFAPARGLPQLDGRLLRGFELPVTIGASMMAPRLPNAETLVARIVCLSPEAMLAGLTIPLRAARELNRRHGAESDLYSSVTLVARSPDALAPLEQGVTSLGFRVGEGQATARRLGGLIRAVARAFLGVAILLLALAAALVAVAFHGMLRARAPELKLLAALGATRRMLVWQAILEAACIGLVGGAVGLGLAWSAQLGLQAAIKDFGKDFGAALPASLVGLELLPSLVATGLGVSAAVLGAAAAVAGVLRRETQLG